MTTATKKPRGLQDCLECGGTGRFKEWDGEQYVSGRCFRCEGSGDLADCGYCGEPTAMPELEMHHGFCFSCETDLQTSDAASEALRLMRRSA